MRSNERAVSYFTGPSGKPYIYIFGLNVVYLCGLIVQKIDHKKSVVYVLVY